jgi:predicted amidophosphoribosyltransferase
VADVASVQGVPVGMWWRVGRAVWAFPRLTRAVAWELARNAARGSADRTYTREFGEPIADRRCLVCATDDVALEGWVATTGGVVCAECSRAVLADGLGYGHIAAAYRGRSGSPRRTFGEVYQTIVAFKERRGDWTSLAGPLARALARSVDQIRPDEASGPPIRPSILVPVPSYRGRRPHMRMLTALAAVRLPHVTTRLSLLEKRREFTQKGLAHDARREESLGAYAVRRRWWTAIRGRHIIVADDLVTTGTTLDACARVLLSAGAATVDGASIVRAVRAPPERMLPLGARQVRIQLRELDGRSRTPITPEPGSLWVQFACSPRCPVTAVAGPYPLPTLDVVSYHRWICRCGASHVVRARREWRADVRDCVGVGVGDRRPPELLVGILQGPATFAASP